MSEEEKPYLMRKEILDHGFVELLDVLGDDEAITNAARTSYDKGTTKVSNTRGLIRYLLRHKHMGPFEFGECVWRIRCPFFVARQWFRHRTGSYNEVSLRYSEAIEEYFVPPVDHITTQDSRNRQARTGTTVEDAEKIQKSLGDDAQYLIDKYNGYLEKGVAREIARVNLPLSLYTMYVFKMDVRNLLNFLTLRFDSHAQYEIRQYAIAMADMMEKYFPLTIEAWRDYHKNSINFSDMEIQILRDIFTETENFDIIKKVEEKMDEEDNKKKLPNIEKDEFMDKVKKLMGLEVGLEYLGKEENQ